MKTKKDKKRTAALVAGAVIAGAVAVSGGALVVMGVPYYDGPSALVPRALLSLEPPKVYKRRSAPNMKDGRKAKAK